MTEPNEYQGTLMRDEGGFVLHADGGHEWRLVLLRTPVDEVEKRVVVTGVETGEAELEVEGIRLA